DSINALAFGTAVAGSGSAASGLTGALAGAGAGATNTVHRTMETCIRDAENGLQISTETGAVSLRSDDDSKIVADAGGYALAISANLASGHSGAGAVGASVSNNTIDNTLKASIEDSLINAGLGVSVTANSSSKIDAVAVGAAGAGAGSS